MSIDLKELRMHEYDLMSDEEVVESVRIGNSEALEYLINKYKNFVRAKARSYFLIGAECRTDRRRRIRFPCRNLQFDHFNNLFSHGFAPP